MRQGYFEGRGHKVPPLSRGIIRNKAHLLRETIGATDDYLDLPKLLEILQYCDILEYEVWPREELGSDLGQTVPSRKLIRLRQDVYDGACAGEGFHRFTIAHELGHYFLHQGDVVLGRADQGSRHRLFEDSEWQADAFAGELLVYSKNAITCAYPYEIAERFGVSMKAAEKQWKELKKEGLI